MPPFLDQLRQRKIVQWAIAYASGAFLLLELSDAPAGRWGMTDTLGRAMDLLLVAGFFVTLVLAWYHGERGRQRVSGPELWIIAALLFVSGLLVRQSSDAGENAETSPSETGTLGAPIVPVRPSIAVLPFENLSGDVLDAALVGGIHDEILTQLGKIRSLDTRSRTSVLQYRDSPKAMREMADELDVQYIVEGTIQVFGDSIRINLHLFEGPDDVRIWSQPITRDFTAEDLLALQMEVALEVAAGVGAEVSPADRTLLSVGAPESLAAYERYLQGIYYLSAVEGVGGGAGLGREHAANAIAAFEASIALEPDWPPPRAGLGSVRHWLASWGVEREKNFARSDSLLKSALQTDSLYGPAWASLGFVRWAWHRDFEGAADAYAKAEALGTPGAAWGRAILLMSLGRYEEAVYAYLQAADRNPLSRQIQSQLANAHFCAGRFEEAVETGEIAQRLGTWMAAGVLTASYLKLGRREEGRPIFDQLLDWGLDGAWSAYLYALLDDDRAARLALESAPSPDLGVNTTSLIAGAYVLVEGPDAAFRYLFRVATESPRSLDYFDCTEEVKSLRGDPRYDQLLAQVRVSGRGVMPAN